MTRADEPRFVQVAEEQCTALGVRLPRFGIIEAGELNAVTVGEGPNRGLIAVTRGLLDTLDDDELAAVLAHEASHIRQGDTKLLAANHALMRTAVVMQMQNPLRFENWRQMIIPLLIPPMLLVLLAGSAASALSMQLSRLARRGLKLGRDYIADGEAIRVTHFPEALLSAIAKIGGRGAFEGSYRVEGLLFDGRADHEGGSHPAIQDRLDAIGSLGGELMNPARLRRDSRVPSRPLFGRRPRMAATAYPLDASGRPLEQPRPPSKYLVAAVFHRPRDVLAMAERLHRLDGIPVGRTPQRAGPGTQADDPAGADRRGRAVHLVAEGWKPVPAGDDVQPDRDGRYRADGKFRPVLRRTVLSGRKMPGRQERAGDWRAGGTGERACGESRRAGRAQGACERHLRQRSLAKGYDPNWAPPSVVPILLIAFIIIAVTRPGLLRKLFGVVEPIETDLSKFREFDADEAGKFAARPQTNWNAAEPVRHAPPPVSVTFGRRKV